MQRKLATFLLPVFLALQPLRSQEPDSLKKGLELFHARKFQEAIAQFDQAIASNPLSAEAFLARGNAFAEMGKTERPLEDYAEALRLKPDYEEARVALGRIRARKGDHKRAIEEYSEAIRLRPSDADAFFNRGLIFFGQRNFDAAKSDFDEAIRLNPKFGPAYFNRAKAVRRGGNLSAALTDLETAVRLNPRRANWLYERGSVLMFMGDEERAIADYTESIRLDPTDHHVFNDRAALYGRKQRYDLALIDLTEAIRLQPKLPFFRHGRGMTYFGMGEYEKALADFDDAIRLKAGPAEYDATHYLWRAKTHAKLGHRESALADLEYAGKQMAPNEELWFTRGVVYDWVGEHEKAIQAYDENLRLNPSSSVVHSNRGVALLALGRTDEALAEALKAVALDANKYALNGLGRAYFEKGDFARATAEFGKCITKDATFADPYYNRFLANLRLGNTTDLKSDADSFIKIKGWRNERTTYLAVNTAIIERKSAGEKASDSIIAEAVAKCDPQIWPYTILRFLNKEVSEKQLFEAADNHARMTEARAYLGLYLSAAGKRDEALTHLRWVKESGDRKMWEQAHVTTELMRLGEK